MKRETKRKMKLAMKFPQWCGKCKKYCTVWTEQVETKLECKHAHKCVPMFGKKKTPSLYEAW